MTKYIDSDKVVERLKASPAFENLGEDGLLLLGVTEDIIKKTKTADVVKVVRCMDCKRSKKMPFDGFYYCKRHRVLMESNDFCSRARHKEVHDERT